MKRLIYILFSLFAVMCAKAQTLTPASVVTGGQFVSNSGASMSYTIGQVFTPMLENQRILTQGIQQPSTPINNSQKPVTEPKQDDDFGVGFRVYPNPATTYIFVDHKLLPGRIGVFVFDISGKNVSAQVDIDTDSDPEQTQARISIEQLPVGNYVLRVYSAASPGKCVGLKFTKE